MKTTCFWPRGKLLGGTSAINAMIYIRGNKRDYDHWEELGNPSWNWESVLMHFKKSEDNRVPHIAADTHHHATGGPLPVDTYKDDQPIKSVLASALTELGYKQIVDYNGKENLGFLKAQGTVDSGTRYSSAKAFLVPAKSRENLHIIKHAHVTELTYIQNAVNGVKFTIDKVPYEAVSRKEVILSAGTINTPQILMLSGIGPKDELDAHKIKLRKELPVGYNLQDHLIVPYGVIFHGTNLEEFGLKDLLEATYRYATNRSGLLSTIASLDFMAFVSTVNDPIYPDIQFHMFHCKRKQPDLRNLFIAYGYTDEIVESFVKANEAAEIVVFVATLLNPKSRGRIQLRSADPYAPPKIFPNYFSEKDDLDTMVRAIRILRKLSGTEAFRINEAEIVRVKISACDKYAYDTDDYWKCYSRHISSTIYHPVGTARMGPDTNAVVDATLKVKGVKGLRVADASIMPKIISGNTNAPTIMIGEKVADFIKADWLIDIHSEL